MAYFRAVDTKSGQHLGEVEAEDMASALATAQHNWGNPGEPPVAQLTEYIPADHFIAVLGPAILDNGLRSEKNALWLGACYGDYELEGVGDRTDAVFIHDFVVTESGRGLGSRLIRLLTRLADQLGITIYLNPWASQVHKGLSQEDLEAWYIRHGWNWTNPIDHVMVREPKKV